MKFRSYNEQLLIAQALIGNVFNDIVIDRRHHGLERDYTKPISMDDIIQKEIQIPCIFGDKSIILKSLENQSGAIKLPLYILTSKGLKTDQKRQADLHIDIFYQQDDVFQKLPKDHPAYRPYSLKKRRGLPITIDYDLTLITKYREDLDQMLTNWMVHWRPDIYVKWWHPRNKIEPLQSQILWGQNINIDSNTDNDGKTKFQWKATTNFTFKTWIFPGLNYYEDSFESELNKIGKNTEPIIQKFNIYNITDYTNNDYDEQTGYPVLGDIFDNIGKPGEIDMQALKRTDDFDQIYKYQQSDLYDPTNEDEVYSLYTKYASYTLIPPINDEIIIFKYVYYSGGQPLSALNAIDPSGDLLLHKFNSDITTVPDLSGGQIQNSKLNRLNITQREFGDCYCDALNIKYDYDIINKDLNIYGYLRNDIYTSCIKSTLNSQNGITQQVCLSSNTLTHNIKFNMLRTLTLNKQTDKLYFNESKNIDDHYNINLWNDVLCKRQHMKNMNNKDFKIYQKTTDKKDTTYAVKFKIQNEDYINKLNALKEIFKKNFNNLQLRDEGNNEYILLYNNNTFWKICEDLNCSKSDFQKLNVKKELYDKNNYKYTILINNWLYIVLKTKLYLGKQETDVYDYGIVTLPLFEIVPIFNGTQPRARVVYGLNTNYCISKIINPKTNTSTR